MGSIDYLFNELELDYLLGEIGIITISESDFHDNTIADFRWSGPKSINVTTREKIGLWIGEDNIDEHFSLDSYILVHQRMKQLLKLLFTSDWTFITSFTKHKR